MISVKLAGLIFATVFVTVESKPTTLDIGNACIVQYLKDNERLPDNFPAPADIQATTCRLVMPLIIHAFEKALCAKLSEQDTIEAECVIKEIKSAGALDLMLMQEIIVMSKGLDEEVMKQKLEEIKENLRIVFENAAKNCESDPTYGGLFDDVLEIKNESLAVLRQNYCFTKFAIEGKLIDVKDVDVNPKKIVTSNIDCKTMIMNNRIERENKLLDKLKTKSLSKEQVQCIMDKFQIERAFDSNLALEVIDQLDVTLEVKRLNREDIGRRLENFIKSIFLCAGKSVKNQSSAGEAISIMQF